MEFPIEDHDLINCSRMKKKC